MALPLLFGLASYICYTGGLPGDAIFDLKWATVFQGAAVALPAAALYRRLNEEKAEAALAGVDTLVLESNHDVEWLRSGPYPYSLKARILGDEGHLSNDAAAEFAARMARCGTRCIVLAHLSRENNTPQRAWDTVQRRLNTVEAEVLLQVAPRSEVSPPYGTEVLVCSE